MRNTGQQRFLVFVTLSLFLTVFPEPPAWPASRPARGTAPRSAASEPLRYTAPARTGSIDLVLRRDGSQLLLLLDGNVPVASGDINHISEVRIGGPDHEDTSLTVDYAFGPIPIPVEYHPGALGPTTDNLLSIRGASFNTETHAITGPHSGVITLDGVPIVYSNLTPVFDTVVSPTMIFNAPPTAATINIATGPIFMGSQTDQINDGGTAAFELINFANKTNVIVNGTSIATTFTVNYPVAADGLATLTVNGGGTPLGSVVNIQATPSSVTTNFVGAGPTTVNVGLGGSTQAILGPLNIENPPSINTVVVDDSSDSTARTVTFSSFTPNPADSQGNDDVWGKILGLAPADINYEYNDTDLTVDAGTGGNTITVNATDPGPALFPTIVNTGTGNDAVNVRATSAGVTYNIQGQNGSDTVAFSSNAPLPGTLAGVQGPVNVGNTLGSTTLRIDDSEDTTGKTATITGGAVTGFAPADIFFDTHTSSVTVDGTSGSDTFNVTPSASTAFTIHGNDPTPPASPGDLLALNLAGLTNPVLTDSFFPPGFQGLWTFGNAENVAFDTIETLRPGGTPQPIVVTAGATIGSTSLSGTTTPETGPNTCISVFNCGADGTCGNGDDVLLGTASVDSAGQFTANLSMKLYSQEKVYVVDTCASIVGPPFIITELEAVPALSPTTLAALVLLLGGVGVFSLLRLRREAPRR